MKKLLFPISLLAALLVYSCTKPAEPAQGSLVPVLPDTEYNYRDVVPDEMSFMGEIPYTSSNVDETVTLGRVLFYDKKISFNNRTSCASCHLQSNGFADKSAFSEGFQLLETPRNSMTIVNSAWTAPYFWDQRAEFLEDQALMPIENHIEMGIDDVEKLIVKVEALDYYKELFSKAFGSEEITTERISIALADFMRALVSYRTKFDEGQDINFANFNLQEMEGKLLFENEMQCASCHNGPHFRGWGSANIGLEMEYEDAGQGDWQPGMEGWFKIPSLRNVAVTAPYMHDGRFATLDDVLDHYSTGIVNHPTLDFRLQNNFGGWDNEDAPVEAIKMNMTPHQKEVLKAFLMTLTDHEMLDDQRYADPFQMVSN